MTRLKAIILDFDGVIVESLDLKTEAFAEIYYPYGDAVVKKVVDHHIAHGGVSRYVKFRHYHKELLGIELTEKEVRDLADRFYRLVFQKVIEAPFVPYAYEFIRDYSNIYDLYISTGAPTEETVVIAKAKKIYPYFKGIFGSPEEKTTHIRTILNGSGYQRKEVVFVGDATTDRDAARDEGITFIGRFTNNEEIKNEPFQISDFKGFHTYLTML
jgi:phosphoglycolate phosphatase-like HAD superfamily hydrolase